MLRDYSSPAGINTEYSQLQTYHNQFPENFPLLYEIFFPAAAGQQCSKGLLRRMYPRYTAPPSATARILSSFLRTRKYKLICNLLLPQ